MQPDWDEKLIFPEPLNIHGVTTTSKARFYEASIYYLCNYLLRWGFDCFILYSAWDPMRSETDESSGVSRRAQWQSGKVSMAKWQTWDPMRSETDESSGVSRRAQWQSGKVSMAKWQNSVVGKLSKPFQHRHIYDVDEMQDEAVNIDEIEIEDEVYQENHIDDAFDVGLGEIQSLRRKDTDVEDVEQLKILLLFNSEEDSQKNSVSDDESDDGNSTGPQPVVKEKTGASSSVVPH
ncbi:hypothetical protein ACS0TY_013294 [Phlomoides rotata]